MTTREYANTFLHIISDAYDFPWGKQEYMMIVKIWSSKQDHLVKRVGNVNLSKHASRIQTMQLNDWIVISSLWNNDKNNDAEMLWSV
jgi:hypothetical protein